MACSLTIPPFLRGLNVIYRDLYQAGSKIRVDSLFFYLYPFLSPLLSPSVRYLLSDLTRQSYFYIRTCLRSMLHVVIHFSFSSERISIVHHRE